MRVIYREMELGSISYVITPQYRIISHFLSSNAGLFALSGNLQMRDDCDLDY